MAAGTFSRKYFSSGTYANYRAYVESWAGRVLQKIKHLTQGEKNIVILDVGCAHGYFLLQARREGYHVQGLEYSNFAIRKAKTSIKKEIQKGSILERKIFSKNHANVVVCFDVCEYLSRQEIKIAVKNLVHWSKQYIFFTDIYKHSKWASQKHNPDPHRRTMLSEKEYENLFKAAGASLKEKWNGGTGCDILIFEKIAHLPP